MFFTHVSSTADVDFVSLTQALTFLPGESVGTSRCLDITILEDEVVENNELFYVTLSFTGTVQAIQNTTANVTIYDDSDCKYLY